MTGGASLQVSILRVCAGEAPCLSLGGIGGGGGCMIRIESANKNSSIEFRHVSLTCFLGTLHINPTNVNNGKHSVTKKKSVTPQNTGL